MGLILAIVILVIVVGIASVGVVGMRRWAKDPTMPKRLPGFNVLTGKWSDEKPSGKGTHGQFDPS